MKFTDRSALLVSALLLSLVGVSVGACSGQVDEELPGDGEEDTQGGGKGGTGGGGGDVQACHVSAPLRRLTAVQYSNVIKETFGGRVVPSELFPPPDGASSRTGFTHDSSVNVVTTLTVEKIFAAAEDVAEGVIKSIAELLPCSASGDKACAKAFLDKYGARLYRRPLLAAEAEKLLALYDEARASNAGFALGVGTMAFALLQRARALCSTTPWSFG